MVQSKNIESLIYDIALSSVVPASITGENKIHEFTNMDLAMKLHYINGVYFFQNSEILKGLTIPELKLPMFKLLEKYYAISGRIRKDEDGRHFIKCNDSGVRIVEVKCTETIEQFLDLSLNDDCVVDDQLVYHQVLGPDLGFSPLVLVQFTRFKCGGLSVGLSWSHVIGDAFSASAFINMWGQILSGQMPPNNPIDETTKTEFTNAHKSVKQSSISFSIKKIEPVGDTWSFSNNSNMKKCTFHISSKKMYNLLSKITAKFDPFEVISAVFWKSIAKVRGDDFEPNIVTLCKKGSSSSNARKEVPVTNSQMISIVKSVDSSRVAETDVLELARILAEKSVDETDLIEEVVGEHRGGDDFIVYGANLTFVNLEELDIYGLELKGNKPDFGNYSFSEVGDEGVVMVLPGDENETEKDGNNGRIVNVILAEDQLVGLKDELLKEWDIC